MGDTKLPTSTTGRPDEVKRSTNLTRSSTLNVVLSFCRPSLGPTSTILTTVDVEKPWSLPLPRNLVAAKRHNICQPHKKMRIQWARPFQATPAFLRNYERQAFSFYSTESLENATSNASTYPMPKLKPCVNVVEAKETTTSSSSCSAADTIRHYYVPRYPPLYNFPVYLTKKAGGRRTLTLIKKIEGSCPV